MQTNNPYFGWILQENPNFWEDNGYKKYPVYRKHLYICSDMQDDSMVEVFRCGIGVVCHEYIVAIHTWNNAGGTKFSLNIAKQVSTIDSFNEFIVNNIGEELEDGTYLLKR